MKLELFNNEHRNRCTNLCARVMKVAFSIGGGFEYISEQPIKLFNRYKENSSDDYYFDIEILKRIHESESGKEKIRNIVRVFDNQVIEKGVKYSLNTLSLNKIRELGLENVNFVFSNSVLWSIIGGIQETRVLVENLKINNQTYSADLIIQFMDDFGANEDDWASKFDFSINIQDNDFFNPDINFRKPMINFLTLNSAKESLLAFWILQNQRNWKPFRNISTFKIKINEKKF